MFESIVSLVALIIAGLAYYRTVRGQLPTVDLIALNEFPDFPDWQLRVHNPTAHPIYLSRIKIHEPAPETDWSIRPEGNSRRGDIERSYQELDGAPPGSGERRVREVHLRIDPETTGVLPFDINRCGSLAGVWIPPARRAVAELRNCGFSPSVPVRFAPSNRSPALVERFDFAHRALRLTRPSRTPRRMRAR